MVFKSKVKEELFQELREFIFWYHYNLSKKAGGYCSRVGTFK